MKKLCFLIATTLLATNMMAQSERVVCIGNTYYCGKEAFEHDQMLEWYAQHNCQAAYDRFLQGQKLAKAGWICLGIGAGLDLGATACTCAYLIQKNFGNGEYSKAPARANVRRSSYSNVSDDPLLIAATALSVGAAAFEIACIPTLVVGYHKMHTSADVYNVLNATAQTRPYWTLQASSNGLGLAYKF